MRLTAIAALIVGLVCAAPASGNPILGEWIYIDFDPPSYQYRIDPTPYSVVQAYVMLDLDGAFVQEFSAVSFKIGLSPGMAAGASFETAGPIVTIDGDWESGITAYTGSCVTTFPAALGVLSFVYQGVPGDITIEDHPDQPRWILDCSTPPELSIYCVYSHGGVGKPPLGGDCGADPVEDASWASIKGLYRPS